MNLMVLGLVISVTACESGGCGFVDPPSTIKCAMSTTICFVFGCYLSMTRCSLSCYPLLLLNIPSLTARNTAER